MKAKPIIRTVAAVAIMVALLIATGCKSRKSGGGGCGCVTPDSNEKRESKKLAEVNKIPEIYQAFDIQNNPFS